MRSARDSRRRAHVCSTRPSAGTSCRAREGARAMALRRARTADNSRTATRAGRGRKSAPAAVARRRSEAAGRRSTRAPSPPDAGRMRRSEADAIRNRRMRHGPGRSRARRSAFPPARASTEALSHHTSPGPVTTEPSVEASSRPSQAQETSNGHVDTPDPASLDCLPPGRLTMPRTFRPLEPLHGWRRVAAQTWRPPQDPSVYSTLDIPMRSALAYLERLRDETGAKVTVTQLVARGVALALRQY